MVLFVKLSRISNPCLDTYQMFSSEGVKVQINEKGIAWESDIKHKFKRAPNSSAIQWIDVEDGNNNNYSKDLLLSHSIRAFYCMDEDCCCLKIPETLGKN